MNDDSSPILRRFAQLSIALLALIWAFSSGWPGLAAASENLSQSYRYAVQLIPKDPDTMVRALVTTTNDLDKIVSGAKAQVIADPTWLGFVVYETSKIDQPPGGPPDWSKAEVTRWMRP